MVCHHCGGSGLSGGAWYDFLDPTKNGVGNLYNKAKEGIQQNGAKLVSGAVKTGLRTFGGPVGSAVASGIDALGYGHHGHHHHEKGGDYTRHGAYTRHHRDGRPYRRSAPASRRTQERNAIVKQVMRDQGLSLIEASKYVKAHGLYK